jgi:hypothetical protein
LFQGVHIVSEQIPEALIRYRGKQRNRRDDVRHSGRVWSGHGAVVKVPANEKLSYLAHPGEWEEISQAQLDAEAAAEFHARGGIETIQKVLPSLSRALLLDLKAMVEAQLDAMGGAPVAALQERDTDFLKPEETRAGQAAGGIEFEHGATSGEVVSDPALSSDPGTLNHHNARVEAVAAAIAELDRKDPEHYTSQGLPRVQALKDRGIEATAAEIRDAMELIKQRGQ